MLVSACMYQPLLLCYVLSMLCIVSCRVMSICVSQVMSCHVASHPTRYLSLFSSGDLTLDSHHHGSCNVAVDSLVTQTPIVVWEGVRWNNRIAPAMMRRAGMEVSPMRV